MFLRPRLWGKPTFLNMLAAYYDVKTEDRFDKIFGSLDIARAPTTSRNSRLVLLFDFSTINPIGPPERVEGEIFETIIATLGVFLHRYRDIRLSLVSTCTTRSPKLHRCLCWLTKIAFWLGRRNLTHQKPPRKPNSQAPQSTPVANPRRSTGLLDCYRLSVMG